MTDVYIVTLSTIGIVITSIGLSVGLNLLLPGLTDRAAQRIDRTPGACLVVGLVMGIPAITVILILLSVPAGAVKGIGGVLTVLLMGVRAIGTAGMSRVLGDRLSQIAPTGGFGGLARGAAALHLACLSPLVGWFLVGPITGLIELGAAAFAAFGWLPKPRPVAAQAAPTGSPEWVQL